MIGPTITDALVLLAKPAAPRPAQLLNDAEIARYTEVRDFLGALLDGLTAIDEGRAGNRFLDATHLEQAARSLLASILGVGEIEIAIAGEAPLQIRETALQGVWMVDGAGRQGIEIGRLPAPVAEAAGAGTTVLMPPAEGGLPDGSMNVLPVLGEISQHLAASGAGHEINLTLLPMTPADHQVLHQAMGPGIVSIVARGYGDCQIQSTGLRDVWHIRYYNSDGHMILEMLQVGGVPVAAQATPEDMRDAITALRDLISAYFQ